MAPEKQTKRPPGGETEDTGLERLQKVMAARGVASRRAAEELIVSGQVSVDGRVVRELGTKVDPLQATIKVNGRILRQPRPKYLLLNKPRGYLTTASDPEGRRTVYDLLSPGDLGERAFPVGRLDMDSEGLLLLTNDGELANRIAHPRYRIDKEYHALVVGHPSAATLAQLRRGGFMLDGGRTGSAHVEVLEQSREGTLLKVIIHEGRRRQVRRIMEEVGHPVLRLRRVRLGSLTLAGVPAAGYRALTSQELARLRRAVGLGTGESAENQIEGDADASVRRLHEPRALTGRKPLRREDVGGGIRRPGGRTTSEQSPREERAEPRREQEGRGGAGGRGRGNQGGGRGGRVTRPGARPGGNQRRPRHGR